MTEHASWNHASCYLKFFNQLVASMNPYPDTEKPNSFLKSFLIHSKILQSDQSKAFWVKNQENEICTTKICNGESRMVRFSFWINFLGSQMIKIKKTKQKTLNLGHYPLTGLES